MRVFFFSSRRRHTRCGRDWSSDVCSSDLLLAEPAPRAPVEGTRVVVKGQARIASGTVGLRLRDPSGRVVSQSYAALPSTAPSWAMFSGALSFVPPPKPQLWTAEAFESSPTDASVTYSVAVPVWVGR